MSFTEWMELITHVFEAVGVAVLVIGFLVAAIRVIPLYARDRDGTEAYRFVRSFFGRSLLLGLEILVAADLIRTVAVAPTIENLAGLGLIVLIRVVLGFSLEVELDGVLPWRRASSDRPESAG